MMIRAKLAVPPLRRRSAAGVTLIELAVVTGIILSVIALSLPSLVNTLATARMRGGMGDLSTLYQRGRSKAVKENRLKFLHFQVSQGHLVAFVDDAMTPVGLPHATPQVYLPQQFSHAGVPNGSGGAPAALTNDSCGASAGATLNTTHDAYFNQLGIPCDYVTAGNCTAGTGFAYYFNYAGALGGSNWAALCVSPAGRIKTWYWTGHAWSN